MQQNIQLVKDFLFYVKYNYLKYKIVRIPGFFQNLSSFFNPKLPSFTFSRIPSFQATIYKSKIFILLHDNLVFYTRKYFILKVLSYFPTDLNKLISSIKTCDDVKNAAEQTTLYYDTFDKLKNANVHYNILYKKTIEIKHHFMTQLMFFCF